MFEWKDAYKVNVPEIDKQHRELFRIGREIADLVDAKDDYDHFDEIMAILKQLKDYTFYHFQYEEKLMEKYGYEGTDLHKIEHLFLTKKIEKFEEEDLDEKQGEAVVELVNFISDWICGHILKTDMKYKDFFNKVIQD
ncbi:bacteriohemerythrin [Lutispora thermophila]|uniref:Hemerythrin n=1 Tax=Lutispora thermophila DSM 19022 TaxID=1122184 RepID=A0A1M6CBK0_9FIRM|nr:bacteriohemerythrin [Lutispora thermophila]SHI58164.1 hemerythrin [Lutispora thermophila DSM 19022]